MFQTGMVRLKKGTLSLLLIVVITLLLLAMIEGVCHFVQVVSSFKPDRMIYERKHTQYDPEIGWVNVPQLFVKDMYGTGKYLQTNSQGFRNAQDFLGKLPKDKIRIICSGDSFTLGLGVSNDESWCQQLTHLDSRLETMNLGQGGYSVGQAYLLYQRKADQFEHQIHIFAFITDDVLMRNNKDFSGYQKPYFTLNDDQLVVHNIPVPKASYIMPWMATHRKILNELSIVKILSSVFKPRPISSEEENHQMLLKMLETFKTRKDTALVAVFLPHLDDFDKLGKQSKRLRSFLHRELKQQNIIFVDLFDDFGRLSKKQLNNMFNKDKHYSVVGNQFVSRLIHRQLQDLKVFDGARLNH